MSITITINGAHAEEAVDTYLGFARYLQGVGPAPVEDHKDSVLPAAPFVNPTPAPTYTSPGAQAPYTLAAALAPATPIAAVPMPPAAPFAPTAPVTPPPPFVPTTQAPAYTLDQITRAGADLITAKPEIMDALMAMLPKYGVQTLTTLKPEQFGAVATELRALGANI